MKGSREHRFVAFEIQAIRDAWHSEISPILLATKSFPLTGKTNKYRATIENLFCALELYAYASI